MDHENPQRSSSALLKLLDETARQMHQESIEDFGASVMELLCEELESLRGILYTYEPERERLLVTASYGVGPGNIQKTSFGHGEGLVGQVMLSRHKRIIDHLPKGQLIVSAGTADVHISTLAILPLVFNEEVFGVLQLERMSAFQPLAVEMLEDVCRNLAAHLQSMLSRKRLEKLLEASRQQTEELEAHEEELRQNMEEMQATQEELSRAREQLNWQIETLNEAAIVSETDARGVITYVNDKFCEISGYEREELIGKTHAVVNSGYFPTSYWKNMYAVIGKGGIFKDLIRNRAQDGHYYWVESTFRAVLNDKGKPEKYIAVRFDVTEQVNQREELNQQREELQASEEELRQNLEESHALQEETERLKRRLEDREQAINAAFCLIEFSPDGVIIKANRQFQKATGYTENELIGQHHRMLMPEGKANEVAYQKFWEDLTQGVPKQGIVERSHKDGSSLWLHASYHPVFNEAGQVAQIQKLAYLSSDHGEKGLNGANGEIEGEFFITTDKEGKISWVDDDFERICGFRLSEVEGLTPGEILQGEATDPETIARIRENFRFGKASREFLVNYTKEGRPYEAEVYIQPVLDKRNELNGFFSRSRILSFLDEPYHTN